MVRRTRWPGCRGGNDLSLGARPTALTQLGTKPAAAARTIPTIGQTANGPDLQKFDRESNLVAAFFGASVFMTRTREDSENPQRRWGRSRPRLGALGPWAPSAGGCLTRRRPPHDFQHQAGTCHSIQKHSARKVASKFDRDQTIINLGWCGRTGKRGKLRLAGGNIGVPNV